jgi:hypothetical protein
MHKIFTKVFSLIVVITSLVTFSPTNLNADVMNPDFLTKKCAPGEKEVVCRFSSVKPFGPRTTDECKRYKNNSNYYYLVGHGSSFGGEEKYCLKVGAQGNTIFYNNYIIIGGVVALIVGISLMALLLTRKRNVN